VGGWLFRHRTALPLPVAAALLILPARPHPPTLYWLGATFVVAGEALRLWAVRQIGVISRTRSDRLGPLVTDGPFGFVRNPLYLGNLALWIGFTLSAGLTYLVPIVFAVLAFAYHAIVRWEERLLAQRLGDAYRTYARQVPRWFPRGRPAARVPDEAGRFSWPETLFSERGTLVAIAAGYGLLVLKQIVRG
jgi:protein-S-isoprenylcysteine O-methyltransferase Ste14